MMGGKDRKHFIQLGRGRKVIVQFNVETFRILAIVEPIMSTCLMIMKYTIDNSIRQSTSDTGNAKEYLEAVGKKFTKFDKAEKETLMKLLITTTYDGVSGFREHIMKLTHFFYKLKGMKVELANNFLVWQVLESLPSQFDALKTSYNAQKEEWDLSEMTAIVTQEEEMIKKEKSHVAFMITTDKGTKKFFKGNSSKSS
ncbi:uncharacterized protein LOC111372006 [Olea europaea var. sylvestris]|uniref:uncharacterized protein LOC111372006 n=1 Tax=Olea europaea var. sylvestris TaxID=158386 RepID=UPI000C1CF423|nr:uncharacterized protein LOC111372006 [Olea europaea var. sylvestris]